MESKEITNKYNFHESDLKYLKVFVRIRPALKREIDNNSYTQCLSSKEEKIFFSKNNKPIIIKENINLISKDFETFQFHGVFDKEDSQSEIFHKIGIPSINSVLDGFNSTIFSYGQTGSGKTFTIEGDRENPGLIPNIFDYLFSQECAKDNSPKLICFFSALQIYLEKVTDLLSDNFGHLKIQQCESAWIVKDLCEIEIRTSQEAMDIFYLAQKKRVVQSTKMNESSSRGHVIYSIKILKQYQDQENWISSKLNLVDLAGSERISKSGTTGHSLKESISINKSLFCLQLVVESLSNLNSCKKNQPPFRDSKLTMILKDSLGGNCITSLIGTISPSLTEASETLSTLNFSSSCRRIINQPKINICDKKKLARDRLYGPVTKKIDAVNEKEMPWKYFTPDVRYNSIKTNLGEIFYLENTLTQYKKIILLLHASPSSSEEFYSWFKALTFYNYKVIAIDQPGFGKTDGKPHPCNSLKNLDKGGPCDIVLSVLNSMNISSKVIVGGYDWGGGVAISLCTKYPKLFERLFVFLPSYAEPTGNELKFLEMHVLVLWVDKDHFHLWSKWKKLAEKIPNRKIEIIKVKFYNPELSANCYEKLNDQIMRPLMIFLGEVDPSNEQEDLIEPFNKQESDVNGNQITAKININFIEYSQEIPNLLKDKDSSKILACQRFKQVITQIGWKIYDEFYRNKEITDLFRELPEISSLILFSNPKMLVNLKIWTSLPNHIESMLVSPKFFPGRKVKILIPCSPWAKLNSKPTKSYLAYDPNLKEKFVSPYGILKNYCSQSKTFIVETVGNDNIKYELSFPENEIYRINHGQIFKINNLNQIELEDGIKANYSSPLVKAKLLEIAMCIADIIEKMDFSQIQDIISFQKETIIKIRKCLNLISFYKGVIRERQGRTDCTGKLAINGQAQCHGLSSTMSSYLHPFMNILGIEILYRGGYSFINSEGDVKVSNEIEKHQWLEVNLRPSMQSYIIDLWYQEQFQDDNFLFMSLENAYQMVSYPHPRLILKNQIDVILENDLNFNI
jgi:hypothetical protein